MPTVLTPCPNPSICNVKNHRTDEARRECEQKRAAAKNAGTSARSGLAVNRIPSIVAQDDVFDVPDTIDPVTGEVLDEQPEFPKTDHVRDRASRGHQFVKTEPAPAFKVDPDLSAALTHENMAHCRQVAEAVFGDDDNIWRQATDPTREVIPKRAETDMAVRRLANFDRATYAEENGTPRREVDLAVDTMTRALNDRGNALKQVRAYVAVRRFKEYQDRIRRIQTQADEMSAYLRTLDPEGTDGKFTYDLGSDAEVSFTPSRYVDNDLAGELLTDEEKAVSERVKITYDATTLRRVLDEETFEALRVQGTTRMSVG